MALNTTPIICLELTVAIMIAEVEHSVICREPIYRPIIAGYIMNICMITTLLVHSAVFNKILVVCLTQCVCAHSY